MVESDVSLGLHLQEHSAMLPISPSLPWRGVGEGSEWSDTEVGDPGAGLWGLSCTNLCDESQGVTLGHF